MSRRVAFRPQAEAEALEARDWYEGRCGGLGVEFAKEVDRAIGAFSANPGVFRKVSGDIRRMILNRFPYAVYFRASREEILVIAVMHGRPHPRRWKSRR